MIQKIATIGICSVFFSSVAAAAEKKTFEELDTDKDGKLTLAEFTPSAKDAEKAPKQFKKKDKDEDGFLSKEEFEAKKAKKKKKPKKEKKPAAE